MKLLAIDGNSIINRAFYGIKMLTTKEGYYTNALVGFFNILSKLEQAEQPDEIAIAFDLKAPTFRHKMFEHYKGQRKGMPQELAQQLPMLKEMLDALGYQMISCEGYEADDILGTLSHACKERGDFCVIATGDRDSFQLINEFVQVQYESTKPKRMDVKAIQEAYGVSPRQLIDVKSLMGDPSDNIPGVPGVGEKTALSLIQTFGSLTNIYQQIDDERIKKAVRQKLLDHQEEAQMSKTLAEILLDVPIETKQGAYRRKQGDLAHAKALFMKLEMVTAWNRFESEQKSNTPDLRENCTVMPWANSSDETAFLYQEEGNFWVIQKSNIFSADKQQILQLLANEKVEKYCFDAKQWFRFAFSHQSQVKNLVFDAKLAAYLLNPAAAEYTVERLAQEYQVTSEMRCDEAQQAVLLPHLCKVLSEQCQQQGMQTLLEEIELPLCEVLADMELRGIAVDRAGIVDFGQELQKALQKELDEIEHQVGYVLNVNSPKQLAQALFEKLQLKPVKKTKSGFSTDAETLEQLREQHPVIEHILRYRVYQKLNSTYVEGLLKGIAEDGRIHSTFNQTETRTGRISSNEPNLQNIPIRTELGSRFRKYFIAKEGYTLIDADYSQIELRVLAHIAKDPSMQQAFLSGEDIHRSSAAKIYGVPLEEVTSEMRTAAKAVNFGIMYGKGAFSLAKDLNITVKEAGDFIKAYLGTYPCVKEYMDQTIEEGKQNGYVRTLYGRRRTLPELSSGNFNIRAQGERMAMNTPIQGTAADIIKLAMVRVYKRLQKEQPQAHLILQVHDELIVECPLAQADEVAKIVQQEMQEAAEFSVPLLVEAHEGRTWYDAKG